MTSPQALFDRDSSLFVARGLYILRYHSGAESSEHPVAAAVPAPGFENVIQVISAPGSTEGGLERPGAAVLIRAADNGKLKNRSEAPQFERLSRRSLQTRIGGRFVRRENRGG